MPQPMNTLSANRCRVGSVTLESTDAPQTRREKLARIVLDAMYQFVGLLDTDGTTLEINRAALEGAGLDLADIEGKPFWEARWFQVSPEITQLQRELVQRASKGEFIRCDMEIYGRAAGDQTIIVDFSLSPVRNEAGAVAFLLAEGRNISAKKQAEAEVARKNAELQTLLDRVRQLDQLRNDLFANVSHELRTPLALILGPTEDVLHTAQLSDTQRQQLQVVQRNAATLLKHVNDLLDLARLDARQMALRCQHLDLAVWVRDTAQQFHAIAPQRGLRYTIATPASLMAVFDPNKFERVLLNLLSNAFKFTPVGGRVHCELRQVSPSHGLLTVEDSGPGIPIAERSAIFERFHQTQHGTTRAHGGTGLGLAIAKEFVTLHQGLIVVTEGEGGGARFEVRLPLQPPTDSHTPAAAQLTPAIEEDREGGTLAETLAELMLEEPHEPEQTEDADDKPAVLVVEDNAAMRRFIVQALHSEFRVMAVENGELGLAQALRTPPDLLITDLMMPRLGGDKLIELMRTHTTLAETPVLVLSARDDESLRARLLQEAAQDYLTKPFSAAELRARARNLSTMKRARDALRHALASQSQDLTQLTRRLTVSRRALQESEYRWWAIYEHSPVGIILMDANGQIRTANPAFQQLVGYSATEVRQSSLLELTPAEDRPATQKRIRRLLIGEIREYHVQRRYQHKDGTLVWTNTSVALIPDDQPNDPLLVVVAEDITAQKQAEHALTRTRNELAQIARASTLGELAASIAHEVNQPLAAIVTNGHAGLRWLNAHPPDPAETRAAIERIIRDANRAGAVITRIRRFLQRGEVQSSALSLETVINDVLGLMQPEAQMRQVKLHYPTEGTLPPVVGDRVQIEQVLINLIMNGLEALNHPGQDDRRLQICTSYHDAHHARLEVMDNGPGMDPSIQERLFEAFQTTKQNSMGMGLAISRSIIENHAGRLWVSQNASGPGVTFGFTLPWFHTPYQP